MPTITALADTLLKEGRMAPDQRYAVLAAQRCRDGLPGFFMAMQKGHADAIDAYGQLLARCELGTSQLTTLLAARTRDEWAAPGLYMALQNGHGDAVRAFGALLRLPGLGDVQRASLLAAKRLDGTPGLYMAMQHNHGHAVRAYGDMVLGCDPAPDVLTRLLDARDPNGTPAFSIAMQMGNTCAIRAYGEVLAMAAPRLDHEQLLALLKVDLRLAADERTRHACLDVLDPLVSAGYFAYAPREPSPSPEPSALGEDASELDVLVPLQDDEVSGDDQPTSSPTGRTVDSRPRNSFATASGERVYGASNA